MHEDADRGNGLLGSSFSKPSPYLTGLGLFRLAPLGNLNEDFRGLITKMISGLSTTIENMSWVDHSVDLSVRSLTRKRTTLRVAAGMGLAHSAGFTIPDLIRKVAIESSQEFVLDNDETDLDSPDFACALLCLFSFDPRMIENIDWNSLEADSAAMRSQNSKIWLDYFQKHLARLELGRRVGMSDYEELSQVFEERIELLKVSEARA